MKVPKEECEGCFQIEGTEDWCEDCGCKLCGGLGPRYGEICGKCRTLSYGDYKAFPIADLGFNTKISDGGGIAVPSVVFALINIDEEVQVEIKKDFRDFLRNVLDDYRIYTYDREEDLKRLLQQELQSFFER